MSYDRKCYSLAQAFLSERDGQDTAQNRHELAQAIQDVIEDWLKDHPPVTDFYDTFGSRFRS